MEELLNKLIEKGWKPFGKRNKLYAVEDGIYILGRIASDWNTYDLRQIVSKESGLWQFVCENDLIDNIAECWYWRNHFELDEIEYNQPDYEYRLIESALKDESELEQFLLSNIAIKDE